MPVNFLCWGRLDDGTEVVRRNPDTVIVIDHLGLLQPNEPPLLAAPWADLPKLLALAAYPNVRVKISGACTLSREAFPVQRYLGAGVADHRRLRHRPLHVGHRLDAHQRHADLRTGRRPVPQHQSPVRQRPRETDGRNAAEGLPLVEVALAIFGTACASAGLRRRGPTTRLNQRLTTLSNGMHIGSSNISVLYRGRGYKLPTACAHTFAHY